MKVNREIFFFDFVSVKDDGSEYSWYWKMSIKELKRTIKHKIKFEPSFNRDFETFVGDISVDRILEERIQKKQSQKIVFPKKYFPYSGKNDYVMLKTLDEVTSLAKYLNYKVVIKTDRFKDYNFIDIADIPFNELPNERFVKNSVGYILTEGIKGSFRNYDYFRRSNFFCMIIPIWKDELGNEKHFKFDYRNVLVFTEREGLFIGSFTPVRGVIETNSEPQKSDFPERGNSSFFTKRKP